MIQMEMIDHQQCAFKEINIILVNLRMKIELKYQWKTLNLL